jgi:hypothetical protein
MTPPVRKAALVAHVGSSVGWIGSVVASLVLALAGVASRDDHLVRAVYLTLEVVGWYALVPFSIASLLTGVVQGVGSTWGLFRHYWVVVKLVMNLVATGVLLLYTRTLAGLADTARATASAADQLRNPSPAVHAVAAIVLLLVALVLSVYKPRGLTRYGQRRRAAERAGAAGR